MDIKVEFTDDPARVLSRASEFLVREPVLHNLILTLLHAHLAQPEPARYIIAMDGNQAVGVVLQSPLDFPATLTPMEPRVVGAVVDAVAQAGITLPGVNGDAGTAASFAGHWSERANSAARPFQANRLYELFELGRAPGVSGKLRQALPSDRALMIAWSAAFHREVGELVRDIESRVDRGLASGRLWLWDDGEAASMALTREPIAGVVRLSGVYTPPAKRKRGYAEACVRALSQRLRDAEYRPILYTDLANPTSNAIYRRVGYRAVAEVLRYRFE